MQLGMLFFKIDAPLLEFQQTPENVDEILAGLMFVEENRPTVVDSLMIFQRLYIYREESALEAVLRIIEIRCEKESEPYFMGCIEKKFLTVGLAAEDNEFHYRGARRDMILFLT